MVGVTNSSLVLSFCRGGFTTSGRTKPNVKLLMNEPTFEEKLEAMETLLEQITDLKAREQIEAEIDYLWYCKDIEEIEVTDEAKTVVKNALTRKEN